MNKQTNKMSKFSSKFFGAIFIFFGLAFATILTFFVINEPGNDSYIKTDAVIERIEEVHDIFRTDETSYVTYVAFIDEDGVLHNNVPLTSYSGTWKVGKTIKIKYLIDDPTQIIAPFDSLFVYFGIVFGGICIVIGIVSIARTNKSSKRSDELYNENSMLNVSINDEFGSSSYDDEEDDEHYYFYFMGKMNQSYLMETESRQKVFFADCKKFPLFKNYEFVFTNYLTAFSRNHQISHTRTYRVSRPLGGGTISVPASSSFYIDDLDIWDVITKLGYSFKIDVKGLKLNYDIYKDSIKIARLDAAGVNIIPGKEKYKLSIAAPGLYKITCKENDVAIIFLIAFALARTERV